MSTSDIERLRAEIVRLVFSGQHSHTKFPHMTLSDFESAVDAKARADEREQVVKEALAATNGLRVELEPLGVHFYKPDGTEVTLGEVLTAIARNGGGESDV